MVYKIENPLVDFETQLKQSHAERVSAKFEELLSLSDVDADANAATVRELREIEGALNNHAKLHKRWRRLRIVSIVFALLLIAAALTLGKWYYILLIGAVGLLLVVFLKLNGTIKILGGKVQEIEAERDRVANVAWEQMSSLNSLFKWGMTQSLFKETLPEFEFDDFFSAERFADFSENYGLSESFNDGRSAISVQSGAFNGNPFIIGRMLDHWVGNKQYFGNLSVTWSEQQRDSNGNWVSVQRSQTLQASVVKPFPYYGYSTPLIYGNEHGPNLTFTHSPSKLSGHEGSDRELKRISKAVKRVEKKARKAVKTGASNLTVMANEEFEALFSATDRDDEVEFRLLFTPVAQQEMVGLLNDKRTSYGDDFSFGKYGTLNLVDAGHISATRIDAAPELFRKLDLAESREFFNNFNNDYFKSLFFAFAPLLTIPLYREQRSTAKGQLASKDELSFWELESLANYIGEENFMHPNSITRNLLGAAVLDTTNGVSLVNIRAYGYQGFEQVDYVPVTAQNGNTYQVPVPWVEYVSVTNERRILVETLANQDDAVPQNLINLGYSGEQILLKGRIAASWADS